MSETFTGHEFVPSLTEPAAMVVDLTGPAASAHDQADAAAVAALSHMGGAVALWRAWRLPRHERADEENPVPVYLLETAGDPTGTGPLQDALASAGRPEAQVEAFAPGIARPPGPRFALGRSALLWAAEPTRPVTMARVFDSWTQATGGQFDADHPLLAGEEAARVIDYLERGHVLLATTLREPDVFDAEAGAVVPANFRTDGRFIWTDAVGYYLRTYALSPDPELLERIRGLDFTLPEVDAVAEHRALVALTSPAS